MKKIFLMLMSVFALSACVHKMDIEQGNIITPEMVSQLHVGMTEEQVKNVMGTPTLLNTFDDNRIDYVYTSKPAYGKFVEKNITLIFRNHRLQEIGGNMYSQYMR
jgi:outer membrane protein assembly factor BamE